MRKSDNSGVCIRGAEGGQLENDYYGYLEEVLQVEYSGLPIKKLVLFKCHWYDPTPRLGTRIHPRYGIVEVRKSRRYNKYDPFIFAQQAIQVYYTPYPGRQREKLDWLVVSKAIARNTINAPHKEQEENEETHAYQNAEIMILLPVEAEDDLIGNLCDEGGHYEELEANLLNEDLGDNEYESQEDEEEEEEEDLQDDTETEEDTPDGYAEDDNSD